MTTDFSALTKLRTWIIVVVGLIVGGAVGAGLSSAITPLYTSTAGLYFVQQQGRTATELNQGAVYTQSQMSSYAALATSPIVLNSVIDTLDLDRTATQLASTISSTVAADTVILRIAVTTPDAQEAARIADAVVDTVGGQAEAISPKDENGASTLTTVNVQAAVPASAPSSPNTERNVGAGLVIGLVLAILLVFVLEKISGRLRGREDIATITGAPILASIARERGTDTTPAIVRDPDGTVAENVRRLRLNVQALGTRTRIPRLVVTSAVAGEGKTGVALSLAIAFAETGATTVLVDANLRRPGVAAAVGLPESDGLSELLQPRSDAGLSDVIVSYGDGGPDLVLAGREYPNPSGLIASTAFAKLMATLGRSYDVVIVDGPDLASVADSAVIARVLDGALVVADVSRARGQQLTTALGTLSSARANVIGVVANKTRTTVKSRLKRRGVAQGHGPTHRQDELAVAPINAEEREVDSLDGVQLQNDDAQDGAATMSTRSGSAAADNDSDTPGEHHSDDVTSRGAASASAGAAADEADGRRDPTLS